MTELFDEIQAVAGRYPDRKSAVLPALRLAQEHYGHLPPEALREVASALGTTPAYCHGIASFYDMFHLTPVGEHIIDVCTNASCALVDAARVLEAFERELGIAAVSRGKCASVFRGPHLSESPISVSSEAEIAIRSAIRCSWQSVGAAAIVRKLGARKCTRQGFAPPSETT